MTSSLGAVSGRCSGPKPQRLTNGPILTSSLPSHKFHQRIDSLTTRAKPAETSTGSVDVD